MKEGENSSWFGKLNFKAILLFLLVGLILIILFQNRGKIFFDLLVFRFLIRKNFLILISICLGAILFAFYPLILQMIKGRPTRKP